MFNKNFSQKAFLSACLVSFLASSALAEPRFQRIQYTSGTGFFISSDGYILTNNHVVKNCKHVTVAGAIPESGVVIIGRDASADLALLKAVATPPATGELRDERYELHPDDMVVTVGFPGGKGPVTREAKVRDIKGPLGETKWLQFTDSVTRGNSGGPLLDSAGNVVGVVTGKADIYLVNMGNHEQESLGKTDLAITLPVVKHFLNEYGVRWRDGTPGGILASHRLEDRARDYIVNVKCRQT
jgi:S1-C subfamily serine protease